jgi:hypothetical protein
MSKKLQLAVDGRSDPDSILVTVDCADNSLMGHDAKLTITAEATVLDSRPVNSKKKLFTKEFRLTSTSQSIAIPRKDLHVYTYRGKEINIDLEAELRIDDGVLFDTKVNQEIVIEGPPRKSSSSCAKHLVEPKDKYRFWANWRAIPLPAKIMTLGLAAVAAVVGAVNTTVGVHDQFSPEGQTYFYSHRDSDGDGQSPLVNSGALTGGAAVAIWVAMRRQLRKYMTFKVKKPLGRIDRRTEMSAGELFHGRSRVPLHDIALRIVACNMEKGQYTRGSGSNQRTVSFKEPVRGVVLFEKRVAEIPRGDDVEKHFPETFSFAPLFDELCPPNTVSSTHGVEVYWEIQLVHETFVDQEIVGSASGVAREEFFAFDQPQAATIADAPLPADFR